METLTALVEDAIAIAHKREPEALGVVLYGSRTWGAEESTSDVDLIAVAPRNLAPDFRVGLFSTYHPPFLVIWDEIRAVLGRYGLKPSFALSYICKDELRRALEDPSLRREISHRPNIDYLDRNSRYIGPDKEIPLTLQLSKKGWSRIN